MDPAAAPLSEAHAALHRRVRDSFERQGMLAQLGVRLVRVEPGLCELALPHSDKVTQQQGGTSHPTGRVVKAGRRLIVTTAEVVHLGADGRRTDCAVMQQTLMPVDETY